MIIITIIVNDIVYIHDSRRPFFSVMLFESSETPLRLLTAVLSLLSAHLDLTHTPDGHFRFGGKETKPLERPRERKMLRPKTDFNELLRLSVIHDVIIIIIIIIF